MVDVKFGCFCRRTSHYSDFRSCEISLFLPRVGIARIAIGDVRIVVCKIVIATAQTHAVEKTLNALNEVYVPLNSFLVCNNY